MTQEPKASDGVSPAPEAPALGALGLSGAIGGAVHGGIIMLIFVIINHYFVGLGSWRTELPSGLISGALLGAFVGALTSLRRARLLGVIAGALVFCLLHGFGLSPLRAGAGFAPAALFFGLLYGGVFGWLVSGAVEKGYKQ